MKNLNRRSWLKTSVTTGAGLFAGSFLQTSAAAFTHSNIKKRPGDYVARLSSNENPFGPAPSAKKALKDAIEDSFLYPRAYRDEFTKKIAKIEGVEEKQILLGAGSSELLHAAARVYGGTNKKVLSADPTYFSLVRSAEALGGEWVKVPLLKNLDHDLSAMDAKIWRFSFGHFKESRPVVLKRGNRKRIILRMFHFFSSAHPGIQLMGFGIAIY